MSRNTIIISIFLVGFLAISAVSAQDNSTSMENSQGDAGDMLEIISVDTGCSVVGDETENPDAYIYAPSKIYYSYQKDYDDYGYDSNVIYGSNNPFEGYLKIYKGSALVSSHFYNDSEDFQTASFFTLINGKKLSLGSYNLKMEGMDGTVWASKSLNVVKNPTIIYLSNFKESIEYSSETFDSCILDEYGGTAHDAKGTLILALDGKQYSATVKNGKFRITFKIPTKARTYICKATYTGDAKYQSSSKTFKLVIYKPAPKLYASNKAFAIKAAKNYAVTLKDNHGKVMKGVKLTIRVNGRTYSAKTNQYGKATFKITNLNKKGTFPALVKYSGSATYKSVSKSVRLVVR